MSVQLDLERNVYKDIIDFEELLQGWIVRVEQPRVASAAFRSAVMPERKAAKLMLASSVRSTKEALNLFARA